MQNISVIKDTKFKNIYVNIRFLMELDKKSVLPTMLLANILNESCRKYSDKRSVTKVLDTMYGATLSICSSIIGKSQMLVAKTQIVDPIYVKEENNLLEDVFVLLHEFVYNPLLKNNEFDKNVFEEAKQNLKDSLLRSEDDPSTYCMYEAMRKAGDSQPLGDGVFGKEEDVDAITMQETVDLYYKIIKKAKCNILVLGNVNKTEINDYAQKYFSFNVNNHNIQSNYCLENNLNGQLFSQNKDISQSYITNIYSTNVKNDSKEFAALKVANAILGQLPTSLLFQEVREKQSLCYSIYSALFPYDGALGISTGVEVGQEEKTLHLIDEQIVRMQKGSFEDEMIDVAKKMLLNSLNATYDSVDAIFGLVYRNILFDRNDTIHSLMNDIEKVEKEDVMQVMNKCKLCTSYILKGEAVA